MSKYHLERKSKRMHNSEKATSRHSKPDNNQIQVKNSEGLFALELCQAQPGLQVIIFHHDVSYAQPNEDKAG